MRNIEIILCTNDILNKYLDSNCLTDGFLQNIKEVCKERGVFNERMFVMLGDHGHTFDNGDHKGLGALDNSMENGWF